MVKFLFGRLYRHFILVEVELQCRTWVVVLPEVPPYVFVIWRMKWLRNCKARCVYFETEYERKCRSNVLESFSRITNGTVVPHVFLFLNFLNFLQDWPRNWLFSRQATADTVGESGLHWLTPLWTYRDSEVRFWTDSVVYEDGFLMQRNSLRGLSFIYQMLLSVVILILQVRAAGMGIAVALTMTEAGRITMTTQCQHIIGGPWGAAFSVLLDQSECSIVRQQAALLLVNLTSQQLPSSDTSSPSDVLYGPVVRNDETQVENRPHKLFGLVDKKLFIRYRV